MGKRKRAGFVWDRGIVPKPKQSPVSGIVREDLPQLNRTEKKLRELEQLAQTNPLAFKARFKDSRKRFVKLLEQTITTINTAMDEINRYPHTIGRLPSYESLYGLSAELRKKLQRYEKEIEQEQLDETKKIIVLSKKTRRKTT